MRSTFRSLLLVGSLFLPAAPALSAQMAAHPAAMATSADLRVSLNLLLSEHAALAAAATGAALGGRTPEFQAAAAALDQNSVALSKAIGSAYGADAESAFLALWRTHINFFVNYTMAVAKKDKAGQDRAVTDLIGYARTFAVFLNHANPSLPVDAVEGLVKDHVVSLKDVVDAQGRGDLAAAYLKLRAATMHMQMIADPLAGAIAAQFPDKFGMH